ncbi:uncharacterized protein [Fopius arisanus]|uniref:RNA-directed DNA polymerase n=1 Tax=Fopius arisanus TaxID=64838 RepID=A0A9R1TP34_9HYME|nr:PREDICTED: uncharacterized protein LOC105272611 [Fopius arisanus]
MYDGEIPDLEAWKLVVPREYCAPVLEESHCSAQAGHPGTDKTYRRLAQSYYWPKMARDVLAFVSQLAADIVGPLTRSKAGFCYILVVQDLYTKWIEVCPLRQATGRKIRECLEGVVINRWGTPDILLTDNGTEFVNRELKATAQQAGIQLHTTPPFHPQANPVERVNRVLQTMIRAFLGEDHREWDEHLYEFRFAYNTAHHCSTNMTSAFANFGREPIPARSWKKEVGSVEATPPLPAEWETRMRRIDTVRVVITHALEEAHRGQAHYYNLRRRASTYQEGGQVLTRRHALFNAAKNFTASLCTLYQGPWVIKRKVSPTVVELVDLHGRPRGKMSTHDLKIDMSCPGDLPAEDWSISSEMEDLLLREDSDGDIIIVEDLSAPTRTPDPEALARAQRADDANAFYALDDLLQAHLEEFSDSFPDGPLWRPFAQHGSLLRWLTECVPGFDISLWEFVVRATHRRRDQHGSILEETDRAIRAAGSLRFLVPMPTGPLWAPLQQHAIAMRWLGKQFSTFFQDLIQ